MKRAPQTPRTVEARTREVALTSYQHDRLAERIVQLDILPQAADEYAIWIKAGGHLDLVRDNAFADELIIHASGDHTFIHTVVVKENSLSPVDHDDLLGWSGNPFFSCASYAWGGGKDEVWIERENHWGFASLKSARQLVYGRDFEGLKEPGSGYHEILQEYLHVTGIHWRPERHAYCRFDNHGEFDNIVSITPRRQRGGVTLVSFKRGELEQYLAASGSTLVRMFDFMLLRHSEFTSWPLGPDTIVKESDSLFYRQKIDPGKAAYTRGVQIIRPSPEKSKIFATIKDGWAEHRHRQYCEFLAFDGRNKKVVSISTDPSATTSYFDASSNSLPFETSPVFFRPEVLSKYKADRDKYTVSEEHMSIHCRGGWELRKFDVNDAGQIHTYICYLRDLPDDEQRYWQSFNEEPKARIAHRALLHDFVGEWTDIVDPLQAALSMLRHWNQSDLDWWRLRDEALLERVNTPRTSSQDEWAQAFADLSKLIIEGFEIAPMQARLKEVGVKFNKDERSLALIEKILADLGSLDAGRRLDGLRAVQAIRSNIASHSRGDRASELGRDALEKHGTYQAHFKEVCRTVVDELRTIEEALLLQAERLRKE